MKRRLATMLVGVSLVALGAAGIVGLAAAAGHSPASRVPAVVGTATAGDVTTAAYDDDRDDWDQAEPTLSPSAVGSGAFGRLWSTHLSGLPYAQPLVYGGDVIVTTETARAYALNTATGQVVWNRRFGTPLDTTATDCTDVGPYAGSTSTPVIDPATGTIYVTTRLVVGAESEADSHWYLQAISAASGSERPGFPVEIEGTPVNTPGVPFDEQNSEQRPGLLLLNGVVYIAFASDCDNTPYRGVVVGVDETSGKVTTMWSAESGSGTGPNSQAGIWQSGGGLVSTGAGTIILTTSNGVSPTPAPGDAPPATLSESVVSLAVGPDGSLTPTQFFAPSNAPTLDEFDEDFGSGGPLALPPAYFGTAAIPQLIVQVGKSGRIVLLNAGDMGGYRQGPGGGDDVLQELGPYVGVWGHPAAYGGQGGWVYILESGGGGVLQALGYGVNGSGVPQLTPEGTSTQTFGYTSGSPLVTSDGTQAGSNVVWVVYAKLSKFGDEQAVDAQLMAYAGTPSGGTLPLLYSAPIGAAVKFTTPTASNGIIYVPTRTGIDAFGFAAAPSISAAPVQLGSVPVGGARETTLTLAAARTIRLTGRLRTDGLQGLTRPASPSADKTRTAGPELIQSSGNVPLAPSVVTVAQPRLGTEIAGGARLVLRVRFTPHRPGPIEGFFTIRTSAGTRTVSFTGYATARGLALSAAPLAFGAVSTSGGAKTLAISFSNSWSKPERITGFRLPGRPYRVIGMPRVGTVLAPRRSVAISVLFAPRHAGAFDSRLTIATNEGSATLNASGVGVVGRPHLTLSANRIDFGKVAVGRSRTRVFLVKDTGVIPLEITRAIAPGEPFSTPMPLSEGISIDPGLAARVEVTFAPSVRGKASGRYRINSDGDRGYVDVRFTGTGD